MKRNCIDHALDKLHAEGGYFVAGRSIHWPIAHAMHTLEVPPGISQYVPPDKLKQPWHSLLGFDGEVVHGDDDPRLPMTRRAIVMSCAILLVLAIRWSIWHWWRSRKVDDTR